MDLAVGNREPQSGPVGQANPPCLAGGFGKGACKPRHAKPFIESKVSRPVGSLERRQGLSTRPIYVSFEFAVAVYPVGGTPRHRLPPPVGPNGGGRDADNPGSTGQPSGTVSLGESGSKGITVFGLS